MESYHLWLQPRHIQQEQWPAPGLGTQVWNETGLPYEKLSTLVPRRWPIFTSATLFSTQEGLSSLYLPDIESIYMGISPRPWAMSEVSRMYLPVMSTCSRGVGGRQGTGRFAWDYPPPQTWRDPK